MESAASPGTGTPTCIKQGDGLDVLYRLWPGTRRHLLWGDPALAAGFGRTVHFCCAAGIETCEPLTFRDREGSGHRGGRCAYAEQALAANGGDARMKCFCRSVHCFRCRMLNAHLGCLQCCGSRFCIGIFVRNCLFHCDEIGIEHRNAIHPVTAPLRISP